MERNLCFSKCCCSCGSLVTYAIPKDQKHEKDKGIDRLLHLCTDDKNYISGISWSCFDFEVLLYSADSLQQSNGKVQANKNYDIKLPRRLHSHARLNTKLLFIISISTYQKIYNIH